MKVPFKVFENGLSLSYIVISTDRFSDSCFRTDGKRFGSLRALSGAQGIVGKAGRRAGYQGTGHDL